MCVCNAQKENLGQQVMFIIHIILSQSYDKVVVREKVHSLSLAMEPVGDDYSSINCV